MKSIVLLEIFSILLTVARSTDDFYPKNVAERLQKYERSPEISSPPSSEHGANPAPTTSNGRGDLIESLVKHFKNVDASATEPLPIPDPMFMPDRTYPILTVNVDTTNVTAHGVSHFRIRNLTIDAVKMKVRFVLQMPLLVLIGNYSYSNWLQGDHSGGFNITLMNALSDCNGKLEITRNGELTAAEIVMDVISKEHMAVTLETADVVGFFVNKFGILLFNAVKPYFLSIISDSIRSNINDHLKPLKIVFPNSIRPLDLAIAEGRKIIKSSGFDPYHFPNYQYTTSVYSLDVTNTIMTGLSSFHRVGDVKFYMENHIVNAVVNVGTAAIRGSCSWEAGIMGGIFTKTGSSSFTVDYVDVMISVNQSLDVSKRPEIVDVDMKVGNVQLRMHGAGILDYLAEMGVNVLPNLLRNQILQAVEKPIRRKLQEAMDDVDLERMLTDKMPMFDQEWSNTSNDVMVIEDNFGVEDTLAHEEEDEQRYDLLERAALRILDRSSTKK